MTRRRMVLLAVVGLLAAANAALLFWPDAPAPKSQPPIPTDQQLALFQGKADQACRCVRQRGDGSYDDCWKDYRRAVAPFKPNGIGTACAFEANYWDYFAPFDEHGFSDMSVTLSRAYGACSEAEESAEIAKNRSKDAGGCG